MTTLSLLDWRRQVHDLYAQVRASAEPAAAHTRWRAGRDTLFGGHPDSPLPAADRAGFRGLPYGQYDAGLRFEVTLDTDLSPQRWEVPTATDGVVPFERIGRVHLADLGSLDVWWLDSYGGGVFLPVRDALAGRETYGGGRYLLDTVKGADLGGDVRAGELVVDLNFAYNPSCAYDPRWQCPLAPPGNVLSLPLPVGELGRPE